MDLGLRNKRAIVLAGTKGIGFSIAKNLLQEGAIVAVGSRDIENIHSATNELKQYGDVIGFQIDVSKNYVRDMEWVCDKLNGLDIFVINSGGPDKGNIEDTTDKQWKDGINEVLLSAVRGVRWAAEKMKNRKSGRILTVSSLSARQPIADLVISNVLRSGLTNLAKTAALEYGQFGITINNILPGYVMTNRLKEIGKNHPDFKSLVREWESSIALQRVAHPDEIGKVAAFLCSEAASYITGTDVLVDGGAVKGI